jgi:hypothetical protein
MNPAETHGFLNGLHPMGRMGDASDVIDAVIYQDPYVRSGGGLSTACTKAVTGCSRAALLLLRAGERYSGVRAVQSPARVGTDADDALNQLTHARSVLTVQDRQMFSGVAASCRGVGRDCALDGGEVVSIERDVKSTEGLGEAGRAAGADERHDVVTAGQNPCNGDLRNGDSPLFGDLAQRLHQTQVATEVVALESGADRAEVSRVEFPGPGEVTADQAAGEYGIGGDAYPEFIGRR